MLLVMNFLELNICKQNILVHKSTDGIDFVI